MTTAEKCTSAEAEGSRLPHRQVTDGLLRRCPRQVTDGLLRQCPRADSRWKVCDVKELKDSPAGVWLYSHPTPRPPRQHVQRGAQEVLQSRRISGSNHVVQLTREAWEAVAAVAFVRQVGASPCSTKREKRVRLAQFGERVAGAVAFMVPSRVVVQFECAASVVCCSRSIRQYEAYSTRHTVQGIHSTCIQHFVDGGPA